MASGFFAILDDVATLLDDVATMSKVATEKTAGILGDDLAVNAEKPLVLFPNANSQCFGPLQKAHFSIRSLFCPLLFC